MANNRTSLLNRVAAVLVLILLVLQFTPFFHYGENGETASIIQYIGFPYNFGDVEDYIAVSAGKDYTINDMLMTPILVLVLGSVSLVFCLIKADKPAVALLPAVLGAVGTYGYLTTAGLHAGAGWGLHLLLCIGILALGIVNLVLTAKADR